MVSEGKPCREDKRVTTYEVWCPHEQLLVKVKGYLTPGRVAEVLHITYCLYARCFGEHGCLIGKEVEGRWP